MSLVERVSNVVAFAAISILATACATEPQYPSCSGDTACARNGHHEFCVRGHCQQCRVSADCTGGQVCESNRCVDAPVARTAECEQDNQCPGGQRCSAGHCVTSESNVLARSDNGGQCSFAVVQFGFDDAVLDEATRRGLQTTAQCLEQERTTRYVLVGRADPRGSTEYNLALGQRRADSVRRYLIALGIDASRLADTSEGSEGAVGTDEASWARDRRVDPNRRDTNTTTTSTDGSRSSRH